MYLFRILFKAILVFCSLHNSAHAEDSLSTVMQRMKSISAVKIAYLETRTLELIDQPWEGNGFMFSAPPDILIKEQLQPERILMGVSGKQMYYFDPGNKVRHSREMEHDNPMSQNIAVFKALMTGDQPLLAKMYSVEFLSKPKQWTMLLKAKNNPDSGFQVEISGLPEQPANSIKIEQADGEKSEFILKKESEDTEVKITILRLYQELLDQ